MPFSERVLAPSPFNCSPRTRRRLLFRAKRVWGVYGSYKVNISRLECPSRSYESRRVLEGTDIGTLFALGVLGGGLAWAIGFVWCAMRKVVAVVVPD